MPARVNPSRTMGGGGDFHTLKVLSWEFFYWLIYQKNETWLKVIFRFRGERGKIGFHFKVLAIFLHGFASKRLNTRFCSIFRFLMIHAVYKIFWMQKTCTTKKYRMIRGILFPQSMSKVDIFSAANALFSRRHYFCLQVRLQKNIAGRVYKMDTSYLWLSSSFVM